MSAHLDQTMKQKGDHHEHRQTETDDRARYRRWLSLLFTKRAGIVLRAVGEGIVLRQCELDQLRLQVDQ